MNTSPNARMRSIRVIAGTLLPLCAILLAAQVHAQIGLRGIENAVSIYLAPAHPVPGDIVRLSVRSPILDLAQSEIVWRSGGKTLAKGEGVDTASITIGALGTVTTVEVVVTTADGATASAKATIIPTELDLLVDSNSYIPPFYRGRALPSAGTAIYLEAIPHFKRSNGSNVDNANIIFTWRKNNEVLGTLSGLGKASASVPVEHLFGRDTISVEARTADGLFSNEATFSFVPVKPFLALYQNNPLSGIMYGQALAPTTFIPESEATFAAVPYFAQATSADDPSLRFDWEVNGQTIPQGASNPSGVTINANNSKGVAFLQLELTHATNFYTYARSSWNITFSVGASTQTPFGTFGQ